MTQTSHTHTYVQTITIAVQCINDYDLQWLEHVLSQDDIPQTISTSYGDDEQTVPYTYAIRVCAGMAALGARGVSLLFSSGDGGVGGGNGGPAICKSNDGRNVTTFLPLFPSSCP
jgi:tripeptidyl-peptidase-1